MSESKEKREAIQDLLDELNNLVYEAPEDDARSVLIYCVKQLKIAAASHRQND